MTHQGAAVFPGDSGLAANESYDFVPLTKTRVDPKAFWTGDVDHITLTYLPFFSHVRADRRLSEMRMLAVMMVVVVGGGWSSVSL